MAEIRYLDFDLTFSRTVAGYRVVVNSPEGQCAGEFDLPFAPSELEGLLQEIGRRWEPMRGAESPAMKAATTFGRGLFDAVFAGDILGCFRASLTRTRKEEAGLRIRLHLSETPLLLDLPWEYLYDPIEAAFLARSIWTPIVRHLDLPIPVQPLAVNPPLKMLVMISSPSEFEPKLDAEQEWTNLRAALEPLQRRGLVRVDRLERATLDMLRRRVQTEDYNIFHFTGHGFFDQEAQEGGVILEGVEGKGRWVSGQHLSEMLRDERTLRLVVLNACEGARTGKTDPFAGIAQTLARQGIPAVVAMQFNVTDKAAIAFAKEFYQAVALGYPVDAAVAEARRAILALGNELEWGTPVLYLRAPDGRVFIIKRKCKRRKLVALIALAVLVILTLWMCSDHPDPCERAPSVPLASLADSIDPAQTEDYLKQVFIMWTIEGYLGNYPKVISAFNSILISVGDNNPANTMLGWVEDAKDEAAQAVPGTSKTDYPYLEFNLPRRLDTYGLEKSYCYLWEHALKERESSIKPSNMAATRLALIASVGEAQQREWIGKWNEQIK
jgi:hypothetical protein